MLRRFTLTLAPLGWAMLAVGCAQPEMSMKDMKPPERAKELDQLNKWVGQWTSESEMTMYMGDKKEIKKSTGSANFSWTCDNRVMMEQSEFDMADMGKMHGLGLYAWCPAKKQYHSQWYDSWGGTGHGWMNYCEKCKCWCVKAETRDPMTGKENIGEGCMKEIDANTLEFCWTEWDTFLGMKGAKKFEMKGTSKRKM